jgi:hydrogenase maturation protease
VILLIGYGNDLRRDDGAGLVLAESIEQVWRTQQVAVKRISVHQLTPELAEEIARPEVTGVIFVDTRAVAPGEATPGVQVQPLHVGPPSSSLGHHLDPATVLIYADRLYGRRPPTWLVTVPGKDFGYGEGLSQATQKALTAAQALPVELLARLRASSLLEAV